MFFNVVKIISSVIFGIIFFAMCIAGIIEAYLENKEKEGK